MGQEFSWHQDPESIGNFHLWNIQFLGYRDTQPVTHGKDGNIQKTIEHYTFADSQSTATITVEADKAAGCAILGLRQTSWMGFPEDSKDFQDLYEGAAEHVKEEQIEAGS